MQTRSAQSLSLESLAWPMRGGLMLAMMGSLLVLWQVSTSMGIVGVVFALVGTAIAHPRQEFAGSWYLVVIVGSLLCALSPVVALGAETVGGWMGSIGSLLTICGAIAGLPAMRVPNHSQ